VGAIESFWHGLNAVLFFKIALSGGVKKTEKSYQQVSGNLNNEKLRAAKYHKNAINAHFALKFTATACLGGGGGGSI
jgi:hypothetical protein